MVLCPLSAEHHAPCLHAPCTMSAWPYDLICMALCPLSAYHYALCLHGTMSPCLHENVTPDCTTLRTSAWNSDPLYAWHFAPWFHNAWCMPVYLFCLNDIMTFLLHGAMAKQAAVTLGVVWTFTLNYKLSTWLGWGEGEDGNTPLLVFASWGSSPLPLRQPVSQNIHLNKI
jgi:hypothetical protein